MKDVYHLVNEKLLLLKRIGFFYIFGSNVLNRIVAFLSNIILVRIITKAEYGIFAYAWNIYSLLILVNGMGMDSGVLQLASERGSDRNYTNSVLGYGVRFGFIFNCFLVLVIFLVVSFITLKIEAGRNMLLALSFLPLIHLINGLMAVYLRAQKRNNDFAKLSTTNAIITAFMSVIFAYLLHEKGLVLGYYITGLILIFIGIKVYKVPILATPSLNDDDRRHLIKIAFTSMCCNMLSQLLYLLDIFVLGVVDPQETVIASYKVATTIPSALSFIPMSVIVCVYPYFAEHRQDKDWCLRKYILLLFANASLNFTISLILFLFAPMIISVIYGKQYLDCLPIFRVLVINFFLSGSFRIISGNLIASQRNLHFSLLISVVASCVNIIADYFFIQKWGAIGAAYATVLVVTVSGAMSTSYFVYTLKH